MFQVDEQRAWLRRQLAASLQALAAAGSGQPVLFPEWAPTASELAMHFEHWLSAIREHETIELSAGEATALAALERKLQTMSRDGAEFDADLWTDAAVAESPHWEEVRRLARAALETAGDGDVEGLGDRGVSDRAIE